MKIKLIDFASLPLVLKLSSPVSNPIYDNYRQLIANGHNFGSDEIIVVSGWPDHSYTVISYFNVTKGITDSTCIDPNFEVEPIENKDLLELYLNECSKNLEKHLPHNFAIGADPEIFAANETNQCIPAWEFLGSKADSKVVSREGQKAYWDGLQAEFTTKPTVCLNYQTDSVFYGMHALNTALKKHNPKAKLSIKTAMEFPEGVLQNAKDEHVEFGCMPSENVYGLEGMRQPGRMVPYRTAGGHLHFGIGKKSPEKIVQIVKALDAIVGVACVSLFGKYDNPRRRMMYGLAGEYRLPPHGLEYRVLSNAWLCHPVAMNLVFDIARKVVVLGEKGLLDRVWIGSEKETIDCINSCDVEKAREILKRNETTFKKLYMAITLGRGHKGRADLVYDTYLNGIESLIENPEEIEKNWNLDKPEISWIPNNGNAMKRVDLVYEAIVNKKVKKVA